MAERDTLIITGGSGLVGSYLTELALKESHEVIHLSTRPNYKPSHKGVKAFTWDPEKEYLDPEALSSAKAIFNLAGATVSKRWTPSYKQQILTSRVDGAKTILNALRSNDHQIETVISASAVGYYPSNKEKTYVETDEPAHDFLGSVTQHWERGIQKLHEEFKIPVSIHRIGIVLSSKGGALKEMETPFKLGLGTPLGCGKQWMSWIHAEDLARQLYFSYQNKLSGVYNAGGPEPAINIEFSRQLAKSMRRPFLFPWRGVPGTLLKLAMGEMATLALMSQKVSDQKIKDAGFEYLYPTLPEALAEIYR